MAYTAPPVVIAGAIYTASEHNIYSVANIIAIYAMPQNRCDAYHNTTQVVTDGNTTALTLNSETVDTASMHTTTSDVTIPSGGGGTYRITGSAQLNMSAGTATLHIRVNGTSLRSVQTTVAGSTVSRTCQLVLAAGDVVTLAGQAAGADVTFGSATASFGSRLEVMGPLPPS